MASLSLPRVLQLKKNSLDAEREQFEKFQTLAIQKAINSIETPVKEKHVRSTIIGTFQEQSAITYWMVAIRLPLQDNRIVAWKFCHVTHKLLREGHPACLDDSQRHINMIENLGKLWVHLREGYGKLVHLYTNLLVCKLKFHARNPRFPGNMQLTADELDSIAENDVNNYFQLCVELLDYMDEILNLQAAVFDSLGNARANSMTASGQCRLAALIPCAQDSSQIYDCNVRLLFRLHAALPADTLTGHRERFRQQFRKLSSFYKHASSLQYYRNLLTLPVLPSNPPNFLLQSDFGTYVAPVVSIPEPAPDEMDSVGALIDTSDTLSQMQRVPGYPYPDETESSSVATSPDHLDAFEARATPSPQPDPIVERDRLIDHLQNELRRMRSEASAMVQERNTMLGSMREHCARLETQLQAAKTDLEQEKQKAETLIAQTPEIKQKLAETEEKAKVTDEKFQKLKGAYTQLREEHITLIRQKAEVDKLSASLRAAAAQHESAKTALQQQLNDRLKDVELLQQSASSSEEIEAYKTEIANLRSELEQSRQKEVELETIRASMEALEIENKTARVEQEEKLTTLANELKETSETLKIITQEKEERESELNKVREELVALRDKSSDQYTKVVEEKEAALKHVDELLQQHRQEKEEHDLRIKNIQAELESLQLKCMDTEFDFANQCQQLEEELALKSKELETTTNELADLRSAFDKAKIDSENQALEQTTEISRLSGIVDEFNKYKSESEAEKQVLLSDLDEAKNKINLLETEASTKAEDVSKLKQQLEELSSDNENAAALQSKIIQLNSEIDELRMKLNDSLALIENKKSEYESQQKEKDIELTILSDKLKNVVECKDEIIANLKSMVAEKDEQVISLNVDVTKLSENVLRLEEDLKETRAELEIGRNEFIALNEEHDDILNRNENNLFLKNQEMRDLHNEIAKLKEEMAAEKEKYSNELQSQAQMLEARFASAEDKRLNAECELQDLLQHNTILEADVSALKRQLEDAKAELEKQSSKIVSCAGSAALEVTGGALGALEAGTAREAHAAAARRAADALSDLAKHDQIKGNEESLARSAIFAAHNTAQLSAYITEVSNLSTDMELSEKLNAECKTMLLATQECLESLKNGSVARSSCANARSLVQTASAGAAGADGVGGALSVDDELAGMDRAIEEAASQIEEMLAASRAGDSGVKLEVNGKILDACTTLMGAVKVLVQDARALQAELGDPHTRQKMYRKNPQWSEGLISAAKAVVFAAKLLVTSADEAVGAAGRLEGVSAAAHEVAGSTAQLVAASRARAPPASAPLARLTRASRHVAAATGAVVAAVRAGSALRHDTEALDTTALTLTATRRLEMESKVRSLELEAALEAERARLAALRKRHYTLAQQEENGNMTNGKE